MVLDRVKGAIRCEFVKKHCLEVEIPCMYGYPTVVTIATTITKDCNRENEWIEIQGWPDWVAVVRKVRPTTTVVKTMGTVNPTTDVVATQHGKNSRLNRPAQQDQPVLPSLFRAQSLGAIISTNGVAVVQTTRSTVHNHRWHRMQHIQICVKTKYCIEYISWTSTLIFLYRPF